ncbi:hypothetical protein ABB37_06761 [Leptomonas pyrrhocoris]|uniref:Uncharacterized protein n=1 Tax=Leptomonas pyrrhocoris TaxID=157538 RepID=A0A0M9FXA0_LEPPY|nr:hypothetical protein ABB37_06761 [Leptomonas pyrrhocoris]KPA78000.1 hypothetical protein ABB37_06761 [Leptomonas pyrrhocoris]|eukprot:XP_015656439.1 hypothetical protein ABB37_06761 [Leptomonas pyrrhocoris]
MLGMQVLRPPPLRREVAELARTAHATEAEEGAPPPPRPPALRDVHLTDLAKQEQARRWAIAGDFYQLLLDITELREVLHRRAMCTTEEPQQRRRIDNAEVPHWIKARRLQVMRENQESATAQNEEQAQRLAYFEKIQQQLYQVFLLEESERADRMEVERLQRLNVGGLAEVIAKEYRRVRPYQLRYEAARHPLVASLSHEIAAEEGLYRSMLWQEQTHAFKGIQAAEVRNYLSRVR